MELRPEPRDADGERADVSGSPAPATPPGRQSPVPDHAEAGRLPPTLDPRHPLHGLGYSPAVLARPVVHVREDAESTGEAPVAEEVPVAFVFNGRSRAVMMATPADLEDFAIGFALAEGVVEHAAAIRHLQVVRYGQGIELQLTIPPEAETRLAARGLEGRGGCGVCGIESIREVLRPVRRIERRPAVEREALWRAEAALHDLQSYHQATGAVHAAGWATPDGTLHVVREDVGRHNALDKVIGALARAGTDPRDGFLIVTSRASFEMVQKATTVGVGLLAAVSRPTGLAIRLAEAAGLTLVGLLRGRTASYYT